MAIDLKILSPKELQSLIANAEAHIKTAKSNQIHELHKKINTLLSNAGLILDDVFPGRGGRRAKAGKRSIVAPKYHNPEDPSQTWSGRGKQPLWFAAALKKRGVTAESLLIHGASARKKGTSAKKTAKKATRRRVKRR